VVEEEAEGGSWADCGASAMAAAALAEAEVGAAAAAATAAAAAAEASGAVVEGGGSIPLRRAGSVGRIRTLVYGREIVYVWV
jgi:hypothetical protein